VRPWSLSSRRVKEAAAAEEEVELEVELAAVHLPLLVLQAVMASPSSNDTPRIKKGVKFIYRT